MRQFDETSDLAISSYYLLFSFLCRNMSSKRKSPPTKLQEGNSVTDSGKDTMAACVAETGGLFRPEDGEGGEGGEGADSASSRSSLTGSDVDDAVTPPCKKQRASPMLDHPFAAPQQSLWNLQQQYERFYQANNHYESQRRRAECNSPVLNNNTICTNNNNSAKRSMDDVLKRLTTKMNHSTLADDRRPTPASTPNNIRYVLGGVI